MLSPLRFGLKTYLAFMCLYSCTNAQGLAISETSSATIASLDLRQDTLSLHWINPTTTQPYGTFEQLRKRFAKQSQQLLFATNSGIYTPQFRPLGLHIEQGQPLVKLHRARKGNDNFSMLPNGIFWIKDTKAGVIESHEPLPRADYATQSGPLLLRNGRIHPDFREKSTSFKIRSGVGVCRDGRVRFAITKRAMNFYQFAQFWQDLGCPDALYLDGSISAYATNKNGQWQDTQWAAKFAGIWAVTTRQH